MSKPLNLQVAQAPAERQGWLDMAKIHTTCGWPSPGSLGREVVPGYVGILQIPQRVEILSKKFWKGRLPSWCDGFPKDIKDKLLRTDIDTRKCIVNGVRSFEAALLVSTPELLHDKAYYRLWKFALFSCIHSVDGFTKIWKKTVERIKWRALKSETIEPKPVTGIPFALGERDLSKKLMETPLAWLGLVMTRGLVSKDEATRLQLLVSTRGFPSPHNLRTYEGAHLDHAERLCSRNLDPLPKERRQELLLLSRRVCNKIHQYGEISSHAHLSMTSSASYEGPQRKGGRGVFLGPLFAQWIQRREFKNEVKGETWFGKPYWVKPGYARWQTMCRDMEWTNPDRVFMTSCQNAVLDFSDMKISDPIYGIDQYTGYQLLQFCIELGLRQKGLTGAPFFSRSRPLAVGIPQEIATIAIGEPGCKTRIITVSPSWLTEMLEPFSNEIGPIIASHPSCIAGSMRAAQAYEWVKSVSKKPEMGPEEYFLTSDLTSATDFCRHDISSILLDGLFESFNIANPYMEICKSLLCSPRILGKMMDYRFPNPYLGSTTSSGILMGDPGTKTVLFLHNLVAEEEAYLRFTRNLSIHDSLLPALTLPDIISPWRHFACAGDDHLARGPKGYLQMIPLAHSRNGLEVNFPKNFLSKIGAFYTEEIILRTEKTRTSSSDLLWNRNYEETLHVDIIKMRLLSPCEKSVMLKDEKNPAIGKGPHLFKQLAWMPKQFGISCQLAWDIFRIRFSNFIEWKHVLTYLPKSLGGLGIGFPPPIDELWESFCQLPVLIQRAISLRIEGNQYFEISSCLRSFSQNKTQRGFLNVNPAVEQYNCIFRDFVDDSLDSDGLKQLFIANYPNLDFEDTNFGRKRKLARELGYMPLSEVINMVDRPYLFKCILRGEVEPKAYNTEPLKVRIRNLEEALFVNWPLLPMDLQDGDLLRARAFFEKAGNNLSRIEAPDEKELFVKIRRVAEDLCTLRTPIKRNYVPVNRAKTLEFGYYEGMEDEWDFDCDQIFLEDLGQNEILSQEEETSMLP